MITAVCNSGYELHGNPDVRCNNGQWLGSLPSCVPSELSSYLVREEGALYRYYIHVMIYMIHVIYYKVRDYLYTKLIIVK